MSKVRSKETKLEVSFRKELWKNGFRYRKNSAKYFGKPDIVLKKYKAVIFIDSCFWHGCSVHGSIPQTRTDFWLKKIERNKQRDNEVDLHYKKIGWTLYRFWEHDIKNDLSGLVQKTLNSLRPKIK